MTGVPCRLALHPRMLRARAHPVMAFAFLAGALVACSGSDSTRDPFGRDTVPTTSSGGAGTTVTGDDPGSPVGIKNLSMTAPREEAGSSDPVESVELTFVLEKNTSLYLERLQGISVTFGGKRRTFTTNECHTSIVQYPGSVVTLRIKDDGTGSALFYSGAGAPYYCRSEPDKIPTQPTVRPWGESVTLELSGLLSDAAPWRATATSTAQR